MNANTKRTMIALAVAALFGSSMAYAGDHHDKSTNTTHVNISKNISLSTNVDIWGNPIVYGFIKTDSAAIALIDNSQSVTWNQAENSLLSNNASVSGNVGTGASGNIGVNVAAGDNNAQDNAAALSAADESMAFGIADAEVFVNQTGVGNSTINSGVNNNASLSGNVGSGGSGNIGINVAAGNNNEQKNALAASTNNTDYAQSTISTNQVSSGNQVSNSGYVQEYSNTTQVQLSGPVQGISFGYGYGGYDGTTSGTYSGTGKLSGSGKGGGGGWSPYDDPDGKGGSSGTSFTESGTTKGTEQGQLGFEEISGDYLYANLCGSVTTTQWVIQNAQNSASLSGNVLTGASGNIGVNVAAGTGNLQANSLALSMANAPSSP